MATVTEILIEEFKALAAWAKEEEKHDTPLCELDYNDRFSRISARILEDTGMIYDETLIKSLYPGFVRDAQ